MNLTDRDIARFWSHVDKTPGHGPDGTCWLWTGCRLKGYGQFRLAGRTHRANRLAMFIHNGTWPEFCACHTCDNPPCVNPLHLFDATHLYNMHDRTAKGRSANCGTRGVDHRCCKLSERDVREIIRLLSEGATGLAVAAQFGMTSSAISKIALGHTWKHIDRPTTLRRLLDRTPSQLVLERSA